jgi:hypothetical protein
MTRFRRSSSTFGEPLGRGMETPPLRMSPLYCITYAEVNNFSRVAFFIGDLFVSDKARLHADTGSLYQ